MQDWFIFKGRNAVSSQGQAPRVSTAKVMMTITEAIAEGLKRLPEGKYAYRIGFINVYGDDHETELDASDVQELEELWESLVEEFECGADSVTYVEMADDPPDQPGDSISRGDV